MFIGQELQKFEKKMAKATLAIVVALKVILGSNPRNLLLVSKLDPSLNSHHNVSTGLETMFNC
jgi:hypothetical protein